MQGFEKDPLNDQQDGGDASEHLRTILANIWLILAVTALFCLASVVYHSRLPNMYTAGAQILVEKVDVPKSSQEMMMPSFRGEEDYYGTQLAILTGRKVAAIVAKELEPIPPYAITARRLPKTRIIALSVTQRDPEWAAKIANKFAEVYVREGNREQLFIGEQILKLIPEEDMDSKDVELIQQAGSMEQVKQFNKKEYAESLSAITNDPVIQRLRNEKLEIQSRISEMSQRYKPNHPNVRDLQERLQYVENELKERTRRILSNIRATLGGESRISNVKILEEAYPPGIPSSPNRPRGILIHTIMGLMAGVALVIGFERMNQKIRSDRDFKNVPLPFLGNIPLLEGFSKMKKKSIELKRKAVSLVDALKTDPILSDAIASVRTHILFSMPYEKSRRIMLTSCIPDEGKTTVSVLLSLSLTTLGRKILLIDADMRRPFAHNYVGTRNEKGLSDYLIGQATMEEIVRDIEGSTLKMISAGNQTPNPSELVASDRFKQLLEYAEQHFDRVVIDVPPVLFIPDGLIIAKHVHSGVLVCGSGMVHKKTVQQVKEKFDSIGHSFIGIVVNKVDYAATGGRYKYYQSYKSYYAKAGKKAEVA